MIPPLFPEHKMHMGRSPTVPLQHHQQLPYWPIMWDGVADGFEPLKPKTSFFVADHDAPLARLVTPLMLYVVMSRAISLPDVDLDARDGIPGRVLDCAKCQHRFAIGIRRHGAAIRQHRRIVRVERPKNRALSTVRRRGMVDVVDKKGKAEDVGKKDEFLSPSAWGTRDVYGHQESKTYIAHVVGDLTTPNEKGDSGHPLVGAKAGFAREVMQMRDQARHEIRDTGIGRLRVDTDRVRRNIVNGEVEERRRVDLGLQL